MKYFIGEIHEQHGEYEYHHTRLYQRNNIVEANEALLDEARFWYGGDEEEPYDEDKDSWWQNGEILTSISKHCEEIPVEDFAVLNKYGV